MLKFFVTNTGTRIIGSFLHYVEAYRTLREQDDEGRYHVIYLADESAIDESDRCLDVSHALAITSGDGLIVPCDGDEDIPSLPTLQNVLGLVTSDQFNALVQEPCPSCNGFGDEDPGSAETSSICSTCGSGNTLGDAVLLAIHRAGRLEPANPIVRLIAHYLRGDLIEVRPKHLSSDQGQTLGSTHSHIH